LRVFNQGNNPMAEATTDDAGKARIESLFGELAEVKITGTTPYEIVAAIGTIDLRNGDLSIEYTLHERRTVEITATVDGKPGLPEGHQLWMGWLQLMDTVVDREKGTITAAVSLPRRAKPGDPVNAWLRAPGYRSAMAKVAIPEGDAPIRATFALQRGLNCHVRESGSRPDRLFLDLQHRSDGSEWRTVDSRNMLPRKPRKEADDGWVYLGLDPGRYRLVVHRQNLVLSETDVQPGGANTLAVDYSRLVEIKGRVEVPEGHDFRGVRLEWDGARTGNPFHTLGSFETGRIRVNRKTGEFRVLAIAGARLIARHPELTPDPAVGALKITGARDDVVLKLVEGPTLRFRVPEYFTRHPALVGNPNYRRPGVAVLLCRDESLKDPVFAGKAAAKDQEWVLGGFAPGTYTLFVDVPTALPVIRHGVKLLAGDNDLGNLPMEKGGTIRIRVLVNKPFAPPRISAFATRVESPRFTRGLNSNGEAEVVLSGLLPGRYSVSAGPIMTRIMSGGSGVISKEIEVTAEGGPELTLDLR
jgi:hypothetical protein